MMNYRYLIIFQTNRIVTILACSGRVLRLLEHSRVRQTIELESVPTVLHVAKGSLGDKVICGFSDGRVIQYKIEHFSTNGNNAEEGGDQLL